MKILCDCGQFISDSTDSLPHKARLIADQDYFDSIEAICEPVSRAIAIAREEAHHDKKEAAKALANVESTVYETFRRYAARAIYQCPACGRFHLDSRLDMSQLHEFVPGDDTVPRNLLRSVQEPC